MTKKAASNSQSTKNQNNPLDSTEKLLAIRNLLFGEQVKSLEDKLTQQQATFNEKLQQLEANIHQKTTSIENQILTAVNDITAAIDSSHREHSAQEKALHDNLQALTDSLKEFRGQMEDELGETHLDLDKTAKAIYHSLENEVNLLSQKIERTSKELGSNKADRKTLANLLESMASNLNKSQA